MDKEARERVAQYLHIIYGSPNFSWDEITERARDVLRERAEVIAELAHSCSPPAEAKAFDIFRCGECGQAWMRICSINGRPAKPTWKQWEDPLS